MTGLFSYFVFFLILASIYAIMALGLNLQWGYTGLFNIGVVGFFAVGAYTFSILATPAQGGHLGGFNWPFIPAVLGAMVITGVIALIIGFPTLRLRDDYLAIATIGTAASIQLVANNMSWLTGGSQGIYNIPQPLAGYFQSNLSYNVFFLIMMLVIVGLVYLGLQRMVNAPWGRVLMAIREDETAAGSVGKNAFSYRLQSFVIGAILMGLSGAMYACFIKYISPTLFLPILTFQVWAMLIVGGSGSNLGAIVGAVLVWGLWTGSGTVVMSILPAGLQVKGGAIQIVLIGLVLMLALLFRPRGIMGERKAIAAERARSKISQG
ncbi:branched-chain amino acid ABC transporter permease [Acidihalobacter ferrooxydans]|uniref:Branched-chain amino acid ABC transporter permease n=1 Tax=Acidihalobacter ferrooxydans TaxID=1765967 RepID=A0A1P8UHH8_9GAMM|nr:branched-chain amino acid ABC transporter permease [Acidihalobacter ferrooxydans]APZ43293.1 branched-chain amino acid ABC transporter permease [Acidihalobacter ferrooxydans]